MNFFKSSTFTWWQMGVFKLSVMGFGVAVGAYWADVFLPYLNIIIAITIITGLYIGYVWWQQR